MKIESTDWNPPEFKFATVLQCQQEGEVEIVDFGFVSDAHAGYLDAHASVASIAGGRRAIIPNRSGQLVFRWEIRGWERVKSAVIAVFRTGSDRPISVETISRGAGTHETYGTLAGIRLTGRDQVKFPSDVYTAWSGPYLARIQILEVLPGTRVIVGARRAYFDVPPIAVIGAGAAGLRAAAVLLAKNQSVVLIEARDRFGGRASTVISKGGHALDLGCQWLHSSEGNPWALEAPKGTFAHDQDEALLIKGKAIDPDETRLSEYDHLVSNSLRSTEHGDISALALVKRELAKEIEGKLLGAQAGEIKKEVELRLPELVEKSMHEYRPEEDITAAKAIFQSELYLQGLRAKVLSSAVEEKLKGEWRADKDLRAKLIEKKLAAVEKSHRTQLTSEIEARHREVVRRDVPGRVNAILEDPFFKLAMGRESNLEEGMELAYCSSMSQKDDEADLGRFADDDDFELDLEPPEADVPATGFSGNRMANGGYGALISAYGDRLEEAYFPALLRVKRSCVAQLIDTKQDPILIETNTETFEVAGVVITVPTSIISKGSLEFEPALPAAVRTAFADLPMGHYKKVILPFKLNIFAKVKPREDDDEEDDPSQANDDVYWVLAEGVVWKFLHVVKTNVVIGFVGGSDAERLDALGDPEVARIALAALAQDLGFDPTEHWTEEIVTSRWSKEAFSLGAYTYTRPGGAGARRFLRGTTVRNRIAFAGEALWPDEYGTAHGAYLSGEVAAELLLGKITEDLP